MSKKRKIKKNEYKKIIVNKNDFERVLITEVLPFEIPFVFSNERLYQYKKQEANLNLLLEANGLPINDFINSSLLSAKSFTISFNFKIKRDSKQTRTISLIHPASQVEFIDFYRRYAHLVASLCSMSTFSLRAPKTIASDFFEREYRGLHKWKSATVEEEQLPYGKQPVEACSFFAYNQFTTLGKFFECKELITLEKRFSHLSRFDISKCFPSVYTHSISWAVKGKMRAKEEMHLKEMAFEDKFDAIMQRANHLETHGLVIGPEVSRIFAEIILQRIDCDIVEQSLKCGFEVGRHYEIRRFVDDYFLFYNDPKVFAGVFSKIENILEKYKFYIKPSKTQSYSRPFILDQVIAKKKIKHIVSSYFDLLKNGTGQKNPHLLLIIAKRKTAFYSVKHHGLSLISNLF